MKTYYILEPKTDLRKVVIATSYVSPFSELYSINFELKSLRYKGEVLFDLLLSNGFASNRLLKMNFDGEQLDISKVEVVPKLKSTLLDELYEFFYQHPAYIQASSLPEPQKYVLLNKVLSGEITATTCC